MLATRYTTCPNCEHPIRIGTAFTRLTGVGYIHEQCPAESVLTARCGAWTTTVGHACRKPAKPGHRCGQHSDQPVKSPQRRRRALSVSSATP